MDETDISLILMLLQNSRSPYRELAEKMSLSINAVHRRIQELINNGVIRHFTTAFNLSALGGLSVLVSGRCDSEVSKICDQIGAHEYTYWVSIVGGNRFYIGGYLPELNKLDEYLGFIHEAGVEISQSGIEPTAPYNGEIRLEDLDQLDFQIIESLQKDSRKQVSTIAEDLSVSARTIRRRLDSMRKTGLLSFSLEWYPSASRDIISMVDCTLDKTVNKEEKKWTLFGEYAPHLLYPFTFVNIQNTVKCLVWTDTMNTLKSISGKMKKDPEITRVVPDILFDGYIYDTWRDSMIQERLAQVDPR